MVNRWSGLAQYLSSNQSVLDMSQLQQTFLGKKLCINFFFFYHFLSFLPFVKEALDKDTLQNRKI